MNFLIALGLFLMTAQVDGVRGPQHAVTHTYMVRADHGWNFIAQKDGPAKAETLAKALQHDLAGVFYTSEYDEDVDVVLLKAKPTGKSWELADALSGLECVADSDDEAKPRVNLVRIDLSKAKNLRAYKINSDTMNPTYIIGGDIGEYFVGIKARATET